MAPLATLPVFLKMAGRTAIIAGGSDAAAWKAELVAAAGADVQVFAPHPGPALQALMVARPEIVVTTRAWRPDDLSGAVLAICDEEVDADAFRAAAAQAGVLVNAIDRPAVCDVQFGAIVNRSPLVIAISTDGAAPVFAQALRARIEMLAPPGFAAWAAAARAWRDDLAALALPFRVRRAFWEAFAIRAFQRPEAPPTRHDRETLVRDAQSRVDAPRRGRAILVSAGPGDPELLTLKAVRALQNADVVLFDDLVSPGVLDMARREAQRLNVGKRGFKPSCGQADICALFVRLVEEGKIVVRLKGGDAMVFGRATEEIVALRAAGLDLEVIPGVTTATAAAAAVQASLTERTAARRVQFITAHAREGGLPEDLNWAALADPAATTVVYMGVRMAQPFMAGLIAHGLDPQTPAILIERVSWPQERRLLSTVRSLAERAVAMALDGPCILVVGQAMLHASAE